MDWIAKAPQAYRSLAARLARLPERIALVQFVHVGSNPAAFLLQETLHRIAEGRMRQPVGRPGLLRQEAARHLVFSLCAAFESGQAALDAEFQRLVVSRLEMQAGM